MGSFFCWVGLGFENGGRWLLSWRPLDGVDCDSQYVNPTFGCNMTAVDHSFPKKRENECEIEISIDFN